MSSKLQSRNRVQRWAGGARRRLQEWGTRGARCAGSRARASALYAGVLYTWRGALLVCVSLGYAAQASYRIGLALLRLAVRVPAKRARRWRDLPVDKRRDDSGPGSSLAPVSVRVCTEPLCVCYLFA